jgi:hypothetical protein
VSDWLISKKSSPLKPLCQMNHRGPSIDASYKVSDHLAKQFQRRFLEIDQSETRIAYDGHVC